MSTALVSDVSSLEGRDVDDLLSQIKSASDWLASADPDAARSALDKTVLIREWVRIRKMSEEVAIEASRLECQCLRRLAELDAFDESISVPRRAAGRYLASLTSDQFSVFLDWIDSNGSALSHVYGYKRKGYEDFAEDDIEADEPVRSRYYDDGLDRDISDEQFLTAARNTIARLSRDRWHFTFTVAAAATETLRYFGLPTHNPVLMAGALAAVRQDLRSFPDASVPPFVTFTDHMTGFTHVAWEKATLSQFREMVEIHEQKAAEAVAKSQRWRALLTTLEQRASAIPFADPDGMRCRHLLDVNPLSQDPAHGAGSTATPLAARAAGLDTQPRVPGESQAAS